MSREEREVCEGKMVSTFATFAFFARQILQADVPTAACKLRMLSLSIR
jgi:hypothetical protein